MLAEAEGVEAQVRVIQRLPYQGEAFVLEVKIEREGVLQMLLAHDDEGHRVDQAQPLLLPAYEEVQARLVSVLVDPRQPLIVSAVSFCPG